MGVKKETAGTDVTQGTVVSGEVRRPMWVRIFKGKYQKVSIVIAAIVLVSLLVAVVYIVRKPAPKTETPATTADSDDTYAISDKEFAIQEAARLKAAPLSADASADDISEYYDSLISNQYDAGDYASVVASYDKYMSISKGQTSPFNVYIATAKAQRQLGDKPAALRLLDEAEASVKQRTTDPEQLEAFLETIKQVREDVQS